MICCAYECKYLDTLYPLDLGHFADQRRIDIERNGLFFIYTDIKYLAMGATMNDKGTQNTIDTALLAIHFMHKHLLAHTHTWSIVHFMRMCIQIEQAIAIFVRVFFTACAGL